MISHCGADEGGGQKFPAKNGWQIPPGHRSARIRIRVVAACGIVPSVLYGARVFPSTHFGLRHLSSKAPKRARAGLQCREQRPAARFHSETTPGITAALHVPPLHSLAHPAPAEEQWHVSWIHVTIAPSKGIHREFKLHDDAPSPGWACMNGGGQNTSRQGLGDVAALGLPRVLDHPSTSCLALLGIYWPEPVAYPSPAGRGMLAAKLDFLRLSHIRRNGESSSPWQGFHRGLLPRSCDRFDLPVLHQDVAN